MVTCWLDTISFKYEICRRIKVVKHKATSHGWSIFPIMWVMVECGSCLEGVTCGYDLPN